MGGGGGGACSISPIGSQTFVSPPASCLASGMKKATHGDIACISEVDDEVVQQQQQQQLCNKKAKLLEGELVFSCTYHA